MCEARPNNELDRRWADLGGWREASMTSTTVVLLCAAGATAMGCSSANPGQPSCLPYIAYGLGVSVASDQGGALICDAVVSAREGTYSETLMPNTDSAGLCRYLGAIERAGTYSVHAEHAGFSSDTVADIKVVSSGGDCPHVRPVEVTIRLRPVK